MRQAQRQAVRPLFCPQPFGALHQPAANQIQRLLARIESHTLSIPQKTLLHPFCAIGIAYAG